MAYIQKKGIWRPQFVPTGPIEVDWNHPLAAGLVALYMPGSQAGYNDLTGIGPTLVAGSGLTRVNSPFGPAVNQSATNSALTSNKVPTAWLLEKAGSLIWAGDILSSPINDPTFWGIEYSSTTPDYGPGILVNYNGYYFVYNSAGTFEYFGTGFSCTTYTNQIVSATWKVGGAVSTGQNSLQSSGTWSGSAPIYTSPIEICLGGDTSQPGNIANALTRGAMMYDRAINAEEVAWINAEPFAMVKPRIVRRYYSVVAASGTNVNPGAGSVSFSGKSPTLIAGNTVAPGAGAVSVAGHAPTVAYGYTLAPAAGAVSITGRAPTLTLGLTVAPAAGQIATTGYAPTISTASGAVTVSPGVGSISATGHAPTVLVGTTLSPAAGLVAFAGQIPAVQMGVTVAPGTGSLLVRGYAPVVTYPVTVAPSVGRIGFVGYAPGVSLQMAEATVKHTAIFPADIRAALFPADQRTAIFPNDIRIGRF